MREIEEKEMITYTFNFHKQTNKYIKQQKSK